MKAETIDSIKKSLFAKILHNSDSIHTKTKENDDAITWSGNDHDEGFAITHRDGNSIIPIHKIVQK